MLHNDPTTHHTLVLNLKKIQGMIRKIDTLIKEGTYCWDIVQQINATIGLLKKMNTTLLKSHLMTCWKDKLSSPEKAESFVQEFLRLTDLNKK